MLTGCEGISFFAQAIGGGVAPIYPLQDRPTVILVDDPTDQLGDPSLEGTIASKIGFDLAQAGTLKVVIPPSKVAEVAARLVPDYATTPLDEIGRRVGAAQVISVYIEAAHANADEEAYRPTLDVRVKVIDTAHGARLFPSNDPSKAGDETSASRGYPIHVELFYRTTTSGPRGDLPIVIRQLIDKTSLEIGKLFHKYHEHEPGEKFAD